MESSPTPAFEEPRVKKPAEPIGPLAGIVIILALLIIGGFYLGFEKIKAVRQAQQQEGAVIQVGDTQ